MFKVAILTHQERPQASKVVENSEHTAEQTLALYNVWLIRIVADASCLREASLQKL